MIENRTFRYESPQGYSFVIRNAPFVVHGKNTEKEEVALTPHASRLINHHIREYMKMFHHPHKNEINFENLLKK